MKYCITLCLLVALTGCSDPNERAAPIMINYDIDRDLSFGYDHPYERPRFIGKVFGTCTDVESAYDEGYEVLRHTLYLDIDSITDSETNTEDTPMNATVTLFLDRDINSDIFIGKELDIDIGIEPSDFHFITYSAIIERSTQKPLYMVFGSGRADASNEPLFSRYYTLSYWVDRIGRKNVHWCKRFTYSLAMENDATKTNLAPTDETTMHAFDDEYIFRLHNHYKQEIRESCVDCCSDATTYSIFISEMIE